MRTKKVLRYTKMARVFMPEYVFPDDVAIMTSNPRGNEKRKVQIEAE